MDYKQNIQAIEQGSVVQRQRIESLKKDKQELIEQIKAEYAKSEISRNELNSKLQKLLGIIADEQKLYKKLSEGARNTYVTLLLRIKVLGFFDYKSKARFQEFIDFINLARVKFNEILMRLSEEERFFKNPDAFNLKEFCYAYSLQNSVADEIIKTASLFESRKNRLKDELISKISRINSIYGDDIDALNSDKEISELLTQIKKDFMIILSATYTMMLFKEIESLNDYIERIFGSAKPEVRALLNINNKNSPLNVV